MNTKEKKFKITVPAKFEKAKNGDWRVYGLASTPTKDLQGEVVDPKGLDLAPIEKGRGLFNFDHKKGPENMIGAIDTYKKDDSGLYLGGYLFKNHDRAKAVYNVMSSLKKSDRGRVGLSIEGMIKERSGSNSKTVSKALITGCAVTFNPINTESYCDLVKSFSGVEFEDQPGVECNIDAEKESKAAFNIDEKDTLIFTAEQVVDLIQKALTVGSGKLTQVPDERKGGNALAKEDLDQKIKSTKQSRDGMKKIKKGDSIFYKSAFLEIIENLKDLYPNVSVTEIFETVKDRLNTKFPELKL